MIGLVSKQTVNGNHELIFSLENKSFVIVLTENNELELYVAGCLRKRSKPSSGKILYVWTNIELLWEEHRYVEATFNQGTRDLQVTMNTELLYTTKFT